MRYLGKFILGHRMMIQSRYRYYSQVKNSPTSLIQLDKVKPHVSKSTFEVMNSYMVFKLCKIPGLISISPILISYMNKMGLGRAMDMIIKHTIFRHFCGGESVDEVVRRTSLLEKDGIGSILDYAVEADLKKEYISDVQVFEENKKLVNKMKGMIDVASNNSFIALKMTGFIPPFILQRWSNMLNLIKYNFELEMCVNNGKNVVNCDSFIDMMRRALDMTRESATQLFKIMDSDKDGYVDWIDISDMLSVGKNMLYNILLRVNSDNNRNIRNDIILINRVMDQVRLLCKYAYNKKVRIMIDAEQTYFQDAIDDIALTLSRRFNVKRKKYTFGVDDVQIPIIFNTYQMYLKDAYNRLVMDVERAKRNGYTLGVKLVRGAYMNSERIRAKNLDICDPINVSIEDTHIMYNKAIDFLIQKIVDKNKLSFIIASHNHESIHHTIAMMSRMGLDNSKDIVYFAQLLGMQDNMTYALAESGFSVLKYIPYGPVKETIPYLLRRVQENSSILNGNSEIDKNALFNELRRRFH